MQNKQQSAQKSSETDPILQSKNKAPKNRAALNWGKVRNLLLNKSKPVDAKKCGISISSLIQCQKKPQKHSKNLIRTTKNNMYRLFDVKQSKQIQVPTSLFNESVKLDILSESTIQTVIETVYKIKINIQQQQTNCQLNQFHVFELKTQTPVPNLEKIISSTEGQSSKNTQNNKVLAQIDTTGFWIWQAEEILTYFLIKQYEHFLLIQKNKKLENTQTINQNKDLLINFNQVKTILELGAGSSGLASLAYMKILTEITLTKQALSQKNNHNTPSVMITDGKKENISYLKRNIELNKKQSNPYVQKVENKNNSGSQAHYSIPIISKAEFMLWGTQINEKYDLILSADSLFFEQFHHELIDSLKYSMHEKSIAVFVNPKRGNSMNNFIKLAQIQKFSVDQKFNTQVQKVKQSQQYDPDRHLYYFLCVRKLNN